jgi:CcmD family protein
MKGWDFVILAYGIVWLTLLVYLTNLKKRLRKAAEELAQLRRAGSPRP